MPSPASEESRGGRDRARAPRWPSRQGAGRSPRWDRDRPRGESRAAMRIVIVIAIAGAMHRDPAGGVRARRRPRWRVTQRTAFCSGIAIGRATPGYAGRGAPGRRERDGGRGGRESNRDRDGGRGHRGTCPAAAASAATGAAAPAAPVAAANADGSGIPATDAGAACSGCGRPGRWQRRAGRRYAWRQRAGHGRGRRRARWRASRSQAGSSRSPRRQSRRCGHGRGRRSRRGGRRRCRFRNPDQESDGDEAEVRDGTSTGEAIANGHDAAPAPVAGR